MTVGRSAASAIVADGLTRSFNGQLALVDLTFEAQPGEVLALLGPNGAGKTTTVRLLNGVLAPDRGSSRVLGIDPALDGDEVRRRTGVLTENAGLDDRLTARENLVVTGRIRGMNKTDAGTKATAMLERFGMADRADHRVQGFSTGSAQARRARTRAAARPRGAVPRRADVGPRSRRHTRRHRPHRHRSRRARPHGRALHPLPRRGGTARAPDGGAPPRPAPRVRHDPTSSPASSGTASTPTSTSARRPTTRSSRCSPTRRRRARRARRPGAARVVTVARPRGRCPAVVAIATSAARCPCTARCRRLRRSRTCTSPSRCTTQRRTRRSSDEHPSVDTNAIRAVDVARTSPRCADRRRSCCRCCSCRSCCSSCLPLVIGFAARSRAQRRHRRASSDAARRHGANRSVELPEREQLVVLVNGYLLAPLFLIVPLMVSAVLAADAFAGEKERKTLEALLHLPDRRPRPLPRQAARQRSCPRSSCRGSGSSASRSSRTSSRGR